MRCKNAKRRLRITVNFDIEEIGPEMPSLFTIMSKKTEIKNRVNANRGWGFLEISLLFSSFFSSLIKPFSGMIFVKL